MREFCAWFFVTATLGLGLQSAAAPLPCGGNPPLNQVQIKGSHNSYHRAPRIPLHPSWNYTHPELRRQLEYHGIRQVEFDLHWNAALERFDVHHLPLVDGRSTCRTLRSCLASVVGWSSSHPEHEAIFVFLEPKELLVRADLENFPKQLDAEIAAVVPRKKIFTPGDLQANHPTLIAAVKDYAWPRYDAVRNQLIFVLLDRARYRSTYSRDLTSVEDRLMFVLGDGQSPVSAILSLENPQREWSKIRKLVSEGFIVRTRADADLVALPSRLAAALSSGAQIISTDFVRRGHPHWFPLPGGALWGCSPLFST